MGDIAIKVESLTKEYRLGTIGHGTLREDMQTAWARLRGKEDPNSLVTAKHNTESNEKHFLALDDLNFEIKKGDRVGIIGKNGAGKSTLLKILSRITAPTKGNIYIDGRIGSLLEVGTGFHPELTGRENIYLNGSIMGMKKWEIDKQLDAIIDFSGVEKFIDTPIKRYSSGMFVRLGFAVAAHLEPEILIVDEVLAVGDVDFQKKAIGKMEDVSKNDGRTILFVSHNMGSIRKLCNKGLLLDNGNALNSGSIDSVIKSYFNIGDNKKKYFKAENDSNNDVKILEVSIRDKEQVIKTKIENSEEHYINCVFSVNNLIKGLVVSMEFYNSDGICIFSTNSNDKKYKNKQFNLGLYICKFELPINIMRGDLYSINAYLTIPNIEIIDQAMNCISFEIEDIASPVAISGEGRRGVILPVLNCDIIGLNNVI